MGSLLEDKQLLIKDLTGINSSKKNYYIELKKKSNQILKQNAQLEIINKLAKSINVNMSITEMMESVAERLTQVFSFQTLELYILQEDQLTLEVQLPENFSPPCQAVNTQEKKELLWEAVEKKQSFWRLDTELGQPLLMIVPLLTKDRVVGVLAICSCQETNVDQSNVTFGEQLANQLAVCIENAQLYKEVKEKLAIEAQVRQSAKLAAVGQMAAGVAHELNNPLTAILGNAQLMLREIDDPHSKQYKLATDIIQSSIRCKKIIDGLLTFSRQEKQPFGLVDINQALDRVLNLVGHQIDINQIKLVVTKNQDESFVLGNSQQLEQVLINLILNAKDALAENPKPIISITVETKDHVQLGKTLQISVVDNGQGIKKSDLTSIFNPFFTTKGPGHGTGLGLSVSLGIAEAHEGTIEVESQQGQGSKFTLIIPMERGDYQCRLY